MTQDPAAEPAAAAAAEEVVSRLLELDAWNPATRAEYEPEDDPAVRAVWDAIDCWAAARR